MSSIQFTVLLVCSCIGLVVNARIVKPSYGVAKYQPYQQQQAEQRQQPQTQEYQYQQYYETDSDPAPAQLPKASAPTTTKHKHHQGTKPAAGNYHTSSRHAVEEDHDDHHSHPKYKFSYHVEEHKTGDYKRHEEERDGDVVHGEYSLIEADGTLRTVKYTADKENGFQAIVVKGDAVHKSRR